MARIANNNLTAIPGLPHVERPATRREFLARSGAGFGALAMSYLMSSVSRGAGPTTSPLDPLGPKPPHYRPRAKSVIFLFMEGGPSHVDLYDPKPALEKLAGKPMPASFGRVITAMGTSDNTILVTKGLNAGDKVVTEGQFRLKPGSKVQALAPGEAAPATSAAELDKLKQANPGQPQQRGGRRRGGGGG